MKLVRTYLTDLNICLSTPYQGIFSSTLYNIRQNYKFSSNRTHSRDLICQNQLCTNTSKDINLYKYVISIVNIETVTNYALCTLALLMQKYTSY